MEREGERQAIPPPGVIRIITETGFFLLDGRRKEKGRPPKTKRRASGMFGSIFCFCLFWGEHARFGCCVSVVAAVVVVADAHGAAGGTLATSANCCCRCCRTVVCCRCLRSLERTPLPKAQKFGRDAAAALFVPPVAGRGFRPRPLLRSRDCEREELLCSSAELLLLKFGGAFL